MALQPGRSARHGWSRHVRQRPLDPRLTSTAAVVVLAGLVGISWLGPYRGLAAQAQGIRQTLTETQEQLGQLERLLNEAGGQSAWVTEQERRLEAMRQRLPPSSQVPVLLDALLGSLESAQVQLVDVAQGNLEPVAGPDGQPVRIDETACLGLPVTLRVTGRFHALAGLLQQITGSGFPCLVRVEYVGLALRDSATTSLHATVNLVLYVRET
jgi:hypothetical protein